MSRSCDVTCDVYNETVRTARKQHLCAACREPILPGQKYTYLSRVWEGTAESTKRCERCQAIHEHLRELGEYGDRLWPDEELDCGEEYKEHWGKEPPPEIAALAFWLPGDKIG